MDTTQYYATSNEVHWVTQTEYFLRQISKTCLMKPKQQSKKKLLQYTQCVHLRYYIEAKLPFRFSARFDCTHLLSIKSQRRWVIVMVFFPVCLGYGLRFIMYINNWRYIWPGEVKSKQTNVSWATRTEYTQRDEQILFYTQEPSNRVTFWIFMWS